METYIKCGGQAGAKVYMTIRLLLRVYMSNEHAYNPFLDPSS